MAMVSWALGQLLDKEVSLVGSGGRCTGGITTEVRLWDKWSWTRMFKQFETGWLIGPALCGWNCRFCRNGRTDLCKMASAVNLRFCCDPRTSGSVEEEILEVVMVMPSWGADVCRSLIWAHPGVGHPVSLLLERSLDSCQSWFLPWALSSLSGILLSLKTGERSLSP